MRFLLLLLFLLFLKPAAAQESFLITTRGDTLRGNLTFIQGDKIDQVQVKSEKRSLISALQIRLANQNGTVFKPVKYQDKLKMMKVLLDGYIAYYAFQPSIENQAYSSFLLVRADGARIEVPRLNFKREMTEFLGDAILNDSINSDLLTRNDLAHIITQFNKNLQQATAIKIEERSLSNNPEIKIIDAVLSSISQYEQSTNSVEFQELTEALNDLRLRKLEKKIIPRYLREAIEKNKNQLNEGSAELVAINSILINLNK